MPGKGSGLRRLRKEFQGLREECGEPLALVWTSGAWSNRGEQWYVSSANPRNEHGQPLKSLRQDQDEDLRARFRDLAERGALCAGHRVPETAFFFWLDLLKKRGRHYRSDSPPLITESRPDPGAIRAVVASAAAKTEVIDTDTLNYIYNHRLPDAFEHLEDTFIELGFCNEHQYKLALDRMDAAKAKDDVNTEHGVIEEPFLASADLCYALETASLAGDEPQAAQNPEPSTPGSGDGTDKDAPETVHTAPAAPRPSEPLDSNPKTPAAIDPGAWPALAPEATSRIYAAQLRAEGLLRKGDFTGAAEWLIDAQAREYFEVWQHDTFETHVLPMIYESTVAVLCNAWPAAYEYEERSALTGAARVAVEKAAADRLFEWREKHWKRKAKAAITVVVQPAQQAQMFTSQEAVVETRRLLQKLRASPFPGISSMVQDQIAALAKAIRRFFPGCRDIALIKNDVDLRWYPIEDCIADLESVLEQAGCPAVQHGTLETSPLATETPSTQSKSTKGESVEMRPAPPANDSIPPSCPGNLLDKYRLDNQIKTYRELAGAFNMGRDTLYKIRYETAWVKEDNYKWAAKAIGCQPADLHPRNRPRKQPRRK